MISVRSILLIVLLSTLSFGQGIIPARVDFEPGISGVTITRGEQDSVTTNNGVVQITVSTNAGYSDNSGALGGQPPSYYMATNGNGSALTGITAEQVGAVPTNISRKVYLDMPIAGGATIAYMSRPPNCGNPSVFCANIPTNGAAIYYNIPRYSTNFTFILKTWNGATNTGYRFSIYTSYQKESDLLAQSYSARSFTNSADVTASNSTAFSFSVPASVWTNTESMWTGIYLETNSAYVSYPTGGVFVIKAFSILEVGK